MPSDSPALPAAADKPGLRQTLMAFARQASIEINVQDIRHLEASRALLPAGAQLYVSHLPKQTFEDTLKACAAVREAGFDPVPHIPVRVLGSAQELELLLARAGDAGVEEILLISGDYAEAHGPYSQVADVLRSGCLTTHRLRRVSLGGHPEGHTKVSLEVIRAAELEKARLSAALGLEATFVTQFFFEAEPFLSWATAARAAAVTAKLKAGLAGPAHLATLLKFALRCGVGPSVRALGSRPGAFAKLVGVHGPEPLLTQLAPHALSQPPLVDGIHLFCFGGYLQTCEWLQKLAAGRFELDSQGQLTVTA